MGNIENDIKAGSEQEILKSMEGFYKDPNHRVVEVYKTWMEYFKKNKENIGFIDKGWEAEFARDLAEGGMYSKPEGMNLKLLERLWSTDKEYLMKKKIGSSGENLMSTITTSEGSIGTVVNQQMNNPESSEEIYGNLPVSEYKKNKIDYVAKLGGMDEAIKKKVLESMNTMPVENLNGFVYGLDQNLKAVKDGTLAQDKLVGKIDFGLKVCNANFTQTLNNIEQQVGSDFTKKYPGIFEVGFSGIGMKIDVFVEKMETELATVYPDANQRYWVEKTLLNAHGLDHPKPVPKPKPTVTPAPVQASTDTSDGSSGSSGFGSVSTGADNPQIPNSQSDMIQGTDQARHNLDLNDKIKEQITSIDQKIKSSQTKLEEIKGRLEKNANNINVTKKEIDRLNVMAQQAQVKISSLSLEKKGYEAFHNAQKVSILEAEINATKKVLGEIISNISKEQMKINLWEEQKSDISNEFNVVQAHISELNSQKLALEAQLSIKK